MPRRFPLRIRHPPEAASPSNLKGWSLSSVHRATNRLRQFGRIAHNGLCGATRQDVAAFAALRCRVLVLMCGCVLAEKLATLERRRCVIGLTARHPEDVPPKLFDALVPKPCRPDSIVEAVKGALVK